MFNCRRFWQLNFVSPNYGIAKILNLDPVGWTFFARFSACSRRDDEFGGFCQSPPRAVRTPFDKPAGIPYYC